MTTKHMKRWTSLFIMNIQLKITVRYLLIPILLTLAIATIKKAENNKELLRTWRNWNPPKCFLHCWWEFKMCSTVTVENSMVVLQKITVWLSAIPFLSIYLKELKARTESDICTLMFTAALFIRVKKRKQLKHPSIG